MNASEPQGKILIIDDDPDYKQVVTIILESENYQVVTAENIKEGKEKLFAESPDLILLDIMMDSIFDGYSLCNDIKTSPEFEKFRDTPIIFVSAVKEEAGSRFTFDPAEQGLRGPDDYLDKPVKPEELLDRLKKLLKK